MLMDNMGVGVDSSSGEPFFGPEANSSSESWSGLEKEALNPAQAEQHSLNVEDAKEAAVEKAGENMSSAMPHVSTPSATTSSSDVDELAAAEARADLEGVDVRRDAEVLPKAYLQAVTKIVNRNKKDPHRLVTELDVARWDMMKKAFNRNLGDGLNGGAGV